jgi:enediyne biosynthesis protein E4
MRVFFIAFACLMAVYACRNMDSSDPLFEKIDVAHHGIMFQNTIEETDSINILTLEYIYNGGGVSIADFNNDSLSDIFLTGNTVSNRLYLNKGDFKFEDVSETAGIKASNKWKSSSAVVDINADGLMDIYVCATINPDSLRRENMLFVNQGVNETGIPVFKDQAKEYGINYRGHSSGAAFLDIDNDDDLDLYVMTNSMQRGIPINYREKINDGSSSNTDVLFRNNGNGTFTNISKWAGILHEGYSLGVAIADVNQDGWQDIYVSNDYITNDLLYINNKNGTFTEMIDRYLKHQSQFSMGNDIADINNDAYPDIITLDMLPERNLRRKTVITGNNYSNYINNEKYGYAPQHVRNMLHLNNGDGTFSEIGQLAGVHQTEWSWSPLFADIDNDGFKDLLITNGFPRDVSDKDFANFRVEAGNIASVAMQIDSIPVVKVPNYAFRNSADLTFQDVTQQWGMAEPSFSNGAAFADFDNDGDLDYVVNNINDPIFLYRNNLNQQNSKKRHFLRVKLKGGGLNSLGLGAKVILNYQGQSQYHDHSIYRGYISTVESVIHFGLDTVNVIDSVTVYWPDGKVNFLSDVRVDQTLFIDHENAVPAAALKNNNPMSLLQPAKVAGLDFVHKEKDKIDFNLQRPMPHKFSECGPALAVGDINNDGLEDFYMGGAASFNGIFFTQQPAGSFSRLELSKGEEEDQGALFFDLDLDGDQDLYVVSGSYEHNPGSQESKDRLYLNDGKGGFSNISSSLPETFSNGSCVRACDFDRDGDLDLFVGGKTIPGKYPLPAESYLLVNNAGRFENKTKDLNAQISTCGIVNDALWTDYDNDGLFDLMVVKEFGAVALYRNEGKKFTQLESSGLEKFNGWWNSINGYDFDQDGDMDYVAGNLGKNNYYKANDEQPLKIYAKDFDGNGNLDIVLSCYLKSESGEMREFPVHFWDELNSQSPAFRRKFRSYKKYGMADMDMLLTDEEQREAMILSVNYTSTSYIENIGDGTFNVRPLPVEAQFSPVNGIEHFDVNNDQNEDLLMIGNDFGNEIFTGRHDAFNGLVLLGDGRGNFVKADPNTAGFVVKGNGKALVKLYNADGGVKFLAAQNRDSLKVFDLPPQLPEMIFTPNALDAYAELHYENGSKSKIEFYYGAGYLSQSTRKIRLPANVTELVVFDSQGKSRIVNAKTLAKI